MTGKYRHYDQDKHGKEKDWNPEDRIECAIRRLKRYQIKVRREETRWEPEIRYRHD